MLQIIFRMNRGVWTRFYIHSQMPSSKKHEAQTLYEETTKKRYLEMVFTAE